MAFNKTDMVYNMTKVKAYTGQQAIISYNRPNHKIMTCNRKLHDYDPAIQTGDSYPSPSCNNSSLSIKIDTVRASAPLIEATFLLKWLGPNSLTEKQNSTWSRHDRNPENVFGGCRQSIVFCTWFIFPRLKNFFVYTKLFSAVLVQIAISDEVRHVGSM